MPCRVGPKGFQCLAWAAVAVTKQNNVVVTFLAADCTIMIDDNEVSFDLAQIETLPIAHKWFPNG